MTRATPIGDRRHVTQVVYSLLRGGSERLAYELARRLDATTTRSSICALAMGGPMAETLADAGIPFRVLGCAPGRQWFLIPALYRFFREQRVDVVQTHHVKQLVYSGLGARLAGAKLVHVEHDCWSLRAPRAQRCLRALAPLCHRIVVVGDGIRDFLVNNVGLPASQLSVIPNGVDLVRYRPQPTRTREMLGLPTKGRLIGHVGRLEPEKDLDTLLGSFAIVAYAGSDARLVIVGDGSLRSALQRAARALGLSGRVHFLGNRTDVADLLPHLDVFVLSSRNEGLPFSLLEAMACGRPVVATAVGEIPRVIQHEVTGMMVSPGDPKTLANALAGVLNRRPAAASMGCAARHVIEERYSLARVVGQYQELYSSLLTPAASARRTREALAGRPT